MPDDIKLTECLQDGIPAKKLLTICKYLQQEGRWRELLALVNEGDVLCPSDISGENASEVMFRLGNRGLKVDCLIQKLEQLHMESPLLLLKDPEPLKLLQDLEAKVEVEAGETLQLHCQAASFPYPHYTFFRRDKEISSCMDGILKIEDVLPEHGGHYICRINNYRKPRKDMLWTRWCHVTVKEGLPREALKPRFDVEPEEQVDLCFQADVVLSCHAESSKDVKYQWFKDGSLLPQQTQRILKILKAQLQDSGEYECVASNEYGETKSAKSVVRIYPPNIPPTDCLVIHSQPLPQWTVRGGMATFGVRAECALRLQYQWFHNHRIIHGATANELRRLVTSKEQEGGYHCVISSVDSSGNLRDQVISAEATLEVIHNPNPHSAEDKVALILSVARYNSFRSLPAVYYDIIETTRKLESLHFKVLSFLDLTLEEMMKALQLFQSLLGRGVYGLLYLAGHGILCRNEEFLMPCNASQPIRLSELLYVNKAIDFLQKKEPKVLVVVMEICLKENHVDESNFDWCTPKTYGNWYKIRSNGPGQQAYEEKISEKRPWPRGLFNIAFLETISKKMTISCMVQELKSKFKEVPYDMRDYPMTPNIFDAHMDSDRSLHDMISSKDQGAMNERCHLWNEGRAVPSGRLADLRPYGQFAVNFKPQTSNILLMWCCFTKLPSCHDKIQSQVSLKKLQPSENHMNEIKDYTCPNASAWNFIQLQRLKSPLQFHLNLTLVVESLDGSSERKHYSFDLNLGFPLIAMSREKFIRTEPPTSVREATEHEDHSTESDA